MIDSVVGAAGHLAKVDALCRDRLEPVGMSRADDGR
jgi:hypothetical protein